MSKRTRTTPSDKIKINSRCYYNINDKNLENPQTSRIGTHNSFDIESSDASDYDKSFNDTKELIHDYKKLFLGKLSISKLKFVSIPPISSSIPHVLNLKQEFTFPQSNFTSQKDKSTQTIKPNESRIKTPYPHTASRNLDEEQIISRPQSFPMDSPSSHNMTYTRHAVMVNNNVCNFRPTEWIGDGIGNNIKLMKSNLIECQKEKNVDLEVCDKLPIQNAVQRVIVKPKNQPAPTYKCKKACQRPQTKSMRRKEMSRDGDDESTAINDTKNHGTSAKSSKEMKMATASSESIDFCNVTGSCYIKLCTIVEQLQDLEWEVCISGMRNFIQIANGMNWNSELGARFIPIISRKLIDFFKSPRSNLCRTACQVAGEFFVLAKSTKRPEFDEMVDILLCRTADSNRFIQKDANAALDKMASCIPIHHSVRAVCARGPDHKNPVVRATTARILTEICRKASNELVIGTDANPRTRKRVLSNLVKFLLDKNMETRQNGEKLCKLLKNHKFFNEYFFKDVENNLKIPLKKILHHIN